MTLKHTLKNRPQFVSEKYGRLIQKKGKEEAFRLYSLEVDVWFDGFEKELREELAYIRKMKRECVKEHKPMFEWEEEHYKELLGEQQ